MIHIRRAGALDAMAMADLLNAIIARGGTTAMTEPVTKESLQHFMTAFPGRAAWHLAEDDQGELLGFQWVEPDAALPADVCDIATFTRLGKARLGIGSKLFDHSRRAAKRLGYASINATIRTDNAEGLAYYQSRGFEDYKVEKGIVLDDGTVVDKISKRYRL